MTNQPSASAETISDERLEGLIDGLRIWTEAGRSAAPDLDRDIHAALVELQRLRSPAPEWQGMESAPFAGPLDGHWETDDGAAMANDYAAMTRDQLAYGKKTDLELANAIFMADRGSLELIGLQTAAKERIRWLSVQLAIALRSTATTKGTQP